MNKINIAFCINDAYADKVAVVMTSILENHPLQNISFYIFSSDLKNETLQKLSALTGIEIPEEEFVEAPAIGIPTTAQIVDANKQVFE